MKKGVYFPLTISLFLVPRNPHITTPFLIESMFCIWFKRIFLAETIHSKINQSWTKRPLPKMSLEEKFEETDISIKHLSVKFHWKFRMRNRSSLSSRRRILILYFFRWNFLMTCKFSTEKFHRRSFADYSHTSNGLTLFHALWTFLIEAVSIILLSKIWSQFAVSNCTMMKFIKFLRPLGLNGNHPQINFIKVQPNICLLLATASFRRPKRKCRCHLEDDKR